MGRALDRALLKHEVMPDVGGDPIVESGSNSDGEWTRWADGTQVCSNMTSTTALADGRNGNVFTQSVGAITFPVPFISSPSVSERAVRTSATGGIVWASNTNATPSTSSVLLRLASSLNNSQGYIIAIAIGRWK